MHKCPVKLLVDWQHESEFRGQGTTGSEGQGTTGVKTKILMVTICETNSQHHEYEYLLEAYLAIASTLPPVAMPAAKDVVGHEKGRGEGSKGGPNPQRVGQAP